MDNKNINNNFCSRDEEDALRDFADGTGNSSDELEKISCEIEKLSDGIENFSDKRENCSGKDFENNFHDTTYILFAGELSLLKKCKSAQPSHCKRSLPLIDGAFADNLFICGALTQAGQDLSGSGFFARVADPTGVFLIRCKKDRGYCFKELLEMEIPSYVSVFGQVQTEDTGSGFEIYINPVSVRKITALEKNNWILSAANSAFDRIEKSYEAYTGSYAVQLLEISETALMHAKKFFDSEGLKEKDAEKNPSSVSSPDDRHKDKNEESRLKILEIIKTNSTKKGLLLSELYEKCSLSGISREDAAFLITELIKEDELYLPSGGYIKIL
ncbi:MAG: hypothetical protein PHP13_01740 [Methanomicrobium sp.]|nr:hypothetical protein [Methanomicrobium sp.]